MASFDTIQATSLGYRITWAERGYLLRLAAIPLLIKFICYTVVIISGWEQNFIRQALVMLPSFFADGWMLAHLARLVFLGQRWPFRSTGDRAKDAEILKHRARGIMAGTLVFVAIRFFLAGFMAFTFYKTGESGIGEISRDVTEPQIITVGVYIAMILSTAIFIWVFRFFWLYIPASVNYPIRQFVGDFRSFVISLYMLGAWLLCFLPGILVLGFIVRILYAPYGENIENIPFLVESAVNFMRVFVDTIIGLVSTACMASGIRSMTGGQQSRV